MTTSICPWKYPAPELHNDVARLRKWRLDDLACIEAASSDARIPTGTTVPAPYSLEEGAAFIERQWGRQTKGQGLSLTIADPATDEAKGLMYLGLERVEGHCRIGYWVIPDARGQGLATNAVGLLSRWALASTDIYRLIAHVEPQNEPSRAVVRKNGFVEEGVARSYIQLDEGLVDAIQFSLVRHDLGSPQARRSI